MWDKIMRMSQSKAPSKEELKQFQLEFAMLNDIAPVNGMDRWPSQIHGLHGYQTTGNKMHLNLHKHKYSCSSDIDLNGKDLYLPTTFQERIESISIVNYKIKSIRADFTKFTSLNKIRLYNLGLDEIPANLADIANLKILSIRKNPIRSIPAFIRDKPSLEMLVISGGQIVNKDSLPDPDQVRIWKIDRDREDMRWGPLAID